MSDRRTVFQVRLTDTERRLLNGIAHELKNTPSAVVRTMISQSATRLGIEPALQLGVVPEATPTSECMPMSSDRAA